MNIDLSHKHPDAKKREEADDYVALITPIIKAFFSDYGYETTTLCQQVLGGHGYIQEWGMEQYVRDARIAQIYEGTNGIQALDLIRRKLFIHEGRLPQRFFNLLNSFVNEHQNSEAMNDFVSPLADALKLLEELTDWLVEQGKHNPDELGAAATDYLRIFALTTLAWLWADMARVALEKAPSDDTGFYITKLRTARFFMGRLLPQIYGLGRGIRSGADLMMEFTDDEF
jgi:hypothetical protein